MCFIGFAHYKHGHWGRGKQPRLAKNVIFFLIQPEDAKKRKRRKGGESGASQRAIVGVGVHVCVWVSECLCVCLAF